MSESSERYSQIPQAFGKEETKSDDRIVSNGTDDKSTE